MFDSFLFRFFRRSVLYRLIVIILLLCIIFGGIIHFLEEETFPTVFDGIWWSIVTISTIGFGDYVPHTVIGRILAMLLILIGTGFITNYFVTIARMAVSRENAYVDGSLPYRGSDHIVIVGWNERTKQLLELFAQSHLAKHIVLIDETLEERPMLSAYVHFVKGNPTHENTLIKANIAEAREVMITANQHKAENEADMQAILTILAVKGQDRHIPITAEILSSLHVKSAEHAGAGKIVETNKMISQHMYEQLFSKEGFVRK
jgi:voltage-gated potassium channel